jgi:hypothetical protein
MKTHSDSEKINIASELKSIIYDLDTNLNIYKDDADELEKLLDKHKPQLQILCNEYQYMPLPEIDDFEFHETYSEEYKNSKKEEYKELDPLDRELYKQYVLCSNYEYVILERISILKGEDVKQTGMKVLNSIKALFIDIDKSIIK